MGAEEYRKNALDCLASAQFMQEPGSRAVLLNMARNWLALADRAEKNAKTELVYEPPPPRLRIVR